MDWVDMRFDYTACRIFYSSIGYIYDRRKRFRARAADIRGK